MVDRLIVHVCWNRDCSWLDERTNLNNVVGTRGKKGELGREGEGEGGREEIFYLFFYYYFYLNTLVLISYKTSLNESQRERERKSEGSEG